MKKTQFLLALALTTLLFGRAARSQDSEGSSFCTNLTSIVHAAGDGFHSIRGALDPDSDGGEWFSRVSLPGAQECEVQSRFGNSASCDYPESTSVSDLEDEYAGLVKKLGDCLQKWSKTTEDGPSTYRKTLVKQTRYKQSPTSPITVRVEITKKLSKRHPGYDLQVWVDEDTED